MTVIDLEVEIFKIVTAFKRKQKILNGYFKLTV